MQLFNVTSKFQTWFYKTWIDFSNWKPTELQKSLKGWFVKYIQKQNFTRFMQYSNCYQTYYHKPKKLLLFGKNFHFWQWAIEYSAVLILTSLTWYFILYYLLPFHCSPSSNFLALFLLFFGLSTVGSSLTLSALFLLFCYFNILFFIHGTVFFHSKQYILC